MNAGIQRLDVHGMNLYQAKVAIDSQLRRSKSYRIRVIHGYHQGTEIRDMVREEYQNHPKVIRMETSHPGETDLVLREF
ncbi:MAG TPA: Smr/MutS family protein [Firmicutes bacterium]|nr:Smr/MutS family protein [Bacillota bacterium]